MRVCSVCKYKYSKGCGALFQVPKDEMTRKKWSRICLVNLTSSSLICANHFLPSNILTVGNRNILTKNAEPLMGQHKMSSCSLCKKKCVMGSKSLFCMPKDINKRMQWSEICGINFKESDLICADHFQANSIIKKNNKMSLSPNAVPFVKQMEEIEISARDNISKIESLYLDRSDSSNVVDPLLLTETSHLGQIEEFPMELKNEIFNEEVTQTGSKTVVAVPQDMLYEYIKGILGENLFKINKDFHNQDNRLKISYVKSESRTISTQTNTRICATVQVSEFADDYRFNCFYCSETFSLENWKKFIKHMKKKHCDDEEAFKISEYISDHDYTPINVPQSISDPTTQALHVETVLVDPNLILPRLVEPVDLTHINLFDSFALNPNYTTEDYMTVTNSTDISNTFGNSENFSIVMPTENKSCDFTNIIKTEASISPIPQSSKSKTKSTAKTKLKLTSNKTALSRCLKRSNTIEHEHEEDKQEVISNDGFLHNTTEVPNSNRSNTTQTIKEEGEDDKQEANANESFQQNTTTELTFEYTPSDIIDCLLDNMKNYPVLWEFDDQPFNEDYYEAIVELCSTINDKWSLNIDTLKMRRSVNRVLSFYCSVYPCGNIENMNPFTHYFDKCAAFLPASVHDIAYARCSHCYRCFKCNSELRFHLLQEQKYLKWPFKCVQCKECFSYIEEYELHKHLPHHLEVFRCKQCGKRFTQRNIYNSHMLEHEIKANNEPGNHVCDVCDKVFKIRRDLLRHKIFHGEKKHKCNQCPKKFSTNVQLKHHVQSHTKKYDLVCEVCGKGCANHTNLKQHMLRHTGVKVTCNICNLKLRRSSLNRHLRLVHMACEGTIETTFRAKCYHYNSLSRSKKRHKFHSKNRNYYCKICNIRFDDHKLIREHNKEHHSDDPKWSCKMCTSEFRQKLALKSHYRRKHNLHMYQAFKLVEQNEDINTVLAIKTEELDNYSETFRDSQNDSSIAKTPPHALFIKSVQSVDHSLMEEEPVFTDSIQDEIMKASDNITAPAIESDDDFFANFLK